MTHRLRHSFNIFISKKPYLFEDDKIINTDTDNFYLNERLYNRKYSNSKGLSKSLFKKNNSISVYFYKPRDIYDYFSEYLFYDIIKKK